MQRTLDSWIAHYRSTQRWRRHVEKELRSLRLTLTQWLVLDALAVIHRETRDAVSQLQVGRRLELDKATISDVMARLARQGLVDRAPAYPTHEWRIYLTREGTRLMARGRALIDTVSARFDARSRELAGSEQSWTSGESS